MPKVEKKFMPEVEKRFFFGDDNSVTVSSTFDGGVHIAHTWSNGANDRYAEMSLEPLEAIRLAQMLLEVAVQKLEA